MTSLARTSVSLLCCGLLGLSAAQGTAPATPSTPAAPATAAPAATTPSPVKMTAATLLVTEVTQDGKVTEQFRDATSAAPGDILHMTQVIQNVTNTQEKAFPLKGVALTQVVNVNTIYQTNRCSVAGVKTLFSVDGKAFAPAPLKKKVKVTENGQEVEKEVEVQPSEYTHVRWQLPDLNPGDQIECLIRVTVK